MGDHEEMSEELPRPRSEHGPRAPRRETDIHGWAPGDFDAYRSLLFKTIREQHAQRCAGQAVTCANCGDATSDVYPEAAYRCFHCDVTFCQACAIIHFGPAPTPAEIAALRDDARAALLEVMLAG